MKPIPALLLAAACLFPPPAIAKPAARPLAIGCFTRVKGPETELAQIKAAGFDFAEIGLRDAVALPDDEFDKLVARARALSLPLLAAINFLPPELKVVGPEADPAKQQEYLTRAFARGERLGLKTVVFGSGRSRRAPDGLAPAAAFKQLVDFGRRAAKEAARHKITVAIEPLGPDETNTITSVEQGIELVKAVGHPNFRLVVDYYHFTLAKEDPAAILKTGKYLHHVRIANPAGRAFPLAATESDYATFFRNLARIGYRGGVGIEARTGSLVEDAPRSVSFLRTLAAAPAR
jgi:sugar phosphate isomerase/epimerase